MRKAIRIDAEAEDEISHAIDRYEAEREGLGAEFWDEVRTAMQTLEVPGPECGLVIGLPRELGGLWGTAQVIVHQLRRRTPATWSKSVSRDTMSSSCSMASALIHTSFSGIGVPRARSASRTAA